MIKLRQRRKALLTGLADHLKHHIDLDPSHGGRHVVVWFRRLTWSHFDRLLDEASTRGVGLQPIHPCYAPRPVRPRLMLSFAGLTAEDIATAMEILGMVQHDAAPDDVPLWFKDGATFESGNSLYEMCMNQNKWFKCADYITGVADVLSMQNVNNVCLPKNAVVEQVVDVVKKYLIEHPESRHYSGMSEVMAALQTAFPCTASQ
jgi:hypothetical protein